MNVGRTLFAQLMDFLPLHSFRACVRRYFGDYKVRKFSCLDQFLSLAFAQLTFRESLRDIEACLRSARSQLYHMGIRGSISRSTLADANETRDWRIFADFAQSFIHQARLLYRHEDFGLELDNMIYAFDATTIDLCLSLFPWAQFRQAKSAIKLHTLLDLRTHIPTFISITSAAIHEVNILDQLPLEPGAMYILDLAFFDCSRLFALHQAPAFFVIRAKRNTKLRRLYSSPVDKTTGICSDQIVVFSNYYAAHDFPAQLRRIRYYDAQNDRYLVFLTNNLKLPAALIAELYHRRWYIELFFKWIKQHLRIKAFYGTSENAVKTQIWIAISVYVLVAIIKKQLKLDMSLYQILQILSIKLLDKTPLLQALSISKEQVHNIQNPNQLYLFN
jgi:hypothetical protein